jgi:CBS domain-containing protein
LGWVLGGETEVETKFAARTAREAMSSPAICIGMEKPVAEAARKMTELSVNRLPVLDQSLSELWAGQLHTENRSAGRSSASSPVAIW